MSAAVFVSDIHIASPDGARCLRFIDLLKALERDAEVSELYLLGDIFDLWVADHDYFIERYAAVIARLRALRRRGVAIAYFEGNHDLYLRHFWERELGFAVYEGPAYLAIGGRTVRLEHGDEMNPNDRSYLFLRWFLRTPPIRFLCRRLPGWLVAQIGRRSSAASRRSSSGGGNFRSHEAIDIVRTHAKKAFRDRPFDMLISGHVHTRDDCELEIDGGRCRSVNLGTWLDAPCAFRIDDRAAGFVELADMAEPAPLPATETRAAGMST